MSRNRDQSIGVAVTLDQDRRERRRVTRARELTLHATILAVAVWAAVLADVASPGPLGRFSGFQKGNDFIQFYVAGSLARDGEYAALVDAAGFGRAQAPYLPPGAAVSFPPVYGPQIALFFAPFTWMPYLAAYAAWSAVTIAAIVWAAWICRRMAPALRPWTRPTLAVTAAYPPFAYLVLDGQISAIAVTALTLAGIALERQRRVLAGAALGVLGCKLSLLVPALAVCVIAQQWTLAGTALLVAILQLALAAPVVGMDVVAAYVHNALSFAQQPDLLSRSPYLMASWRTFWASLLPERAAWMLYAVTAAASVGVAAWGWRATDDPLHRVGLLSIAIALASPHLYLYDLVVLVPAFVASAAVLVDARALALRWSTYLAFLSPLAVPLAAFTGIQPITIVLAVWLVTLAMIQRRL
jgi:hypothetical protein